jgi:hypothetical protein
MTDERWVDPGEIEVPPEPDGGRRPTTGPDPRTAVRGAVTAAGAHPRSPADPEVAGPVEHDPRDTGRETWSPDTPGSGSSPAGR